MRLKSAFLSRALLLCVFLLFFSNANYAVIYYVSSSSGNDSNSGLSVSSPWKTLTKVNSGAFNPGDIIRFRRGDTFVGSLSIKRSGTTTRNITFANYGEGFRPIISGFQTVTGWKSLGNGIYSASTAAANTCKMVTVNGINTPKGRYPNTGYLSSESKTISSITDNQLSATPSWIGAEIVVKVNPFVLETRNIISHINSTLSFINLYAVPKSYANGYFLQNDLKCLDLLGEWLIKNGTIYMYFGSNNPNNYQVRTSAINETVIVNNTISNVTLDGLQIQGSNTNDVSINLCNYISVKNCLISHSGSIGIYNKGTSTLIENCTISSTNASAIISSGGAATIRNNTIRDIAIFEGMGSIWRYDGVTLNGDNSVFEYNTIQNVGYNGIISRANNTKIQNNFIDNFCTILTDGGGIYTELSKYTGRVIKNNIVVNGRFINSGTTLTTPSTIGIYLDTESVGLTVSGNTVANIEGHGILLHSSRNIQVVNNTVYNCTLSQLVLSHNTPTPNQSGINVTGNILVSKQANQKVLFQYSDYNDYLFGFADNNVYARPIDDLNTISIEKYSTWDSPTARHDLAWWKAFSGYDANSTKSPIKLSNLNEIFLEYNSTKTARTITLPYPVIDARGVKYSGSLILQPYVSLVLMKDPNPTGLKSASLTPVMPDQVLFDEKISVELYPNPCHGLLNVRFSQLPIAGSRIDVLDITGRLVVSRIISGTSEVFDLSNQTAGLYMVRSTLGTDRIVHKLIISK